MTYFRDVYKKRGVWWGNTSKDQYLNIAKKYFDDYLVNSPDSSVITINGIDTQAAVRDDKVDKDVSRLTKYFLVSLDTIIAIGDIIEWSGSNWLVIEKEKRSFEAYNKVLGIRCNYDLKWIDRFGVLNETPAYVFGGMEKRAEDNFKIANGLIVMPQPNKSIEIILPYFQILNDQRFIIRSEAWRVLERDLVSVDGLLYMSLTEDLVDTFDDSIANGIANYNQLNSGYIDVGLSSLTLGVGDSFTFNPILYVENKVVDSAQFTLSSDGDSYYINISGMTVSGLSNGTAVLNIASVDQPNLVSTCTITVSGATIAEDVLQLVGDDNIKIGRTRTYTVLYNNGGVPVETNATFTLIGNESSLVNFVSQGATSCSLVANTDGLTGNITLRATTAYGVIDKIISVVSVW